ncbi:MAG: toprim domain-containing protein [Candidatus Omnitrophica bacterium]|nr:toprim domain-containing protein [Candidatus Omnitrophota bacterium]
MKNMENYDFRDIIENVRERYDIGEVVSRHVRLTHSKKGICPFHEEKTPSFSVNTKGQYFYCFGCGKGGDVFKFLELYERKSFAEVLRELADRAGIKVPDLGPNSHKHIDEERTTRDILSVAAEYYHERITQEANDYLTKKRGIKDEIISRFKIGYTNGNLNEYLIKECCFPLDICLKAGVLKKREDGTIKDYFCNRIIFPNFRRGQVVHMSARGLGDNEPKYLHLPGEIKYPYNEDSLYEKEVYVVEGILDCLSLIQCSYPAVAVLGASNFKSEYLQKFSRCEKVYICLDGDEAGIKGSLKIGNMIGDKARIASLPEGMDINDYLNSYTKDDFDKLIACSKDPIKYELSFISPDTDKTELPQKLEPILKKLSSMEKARIEAYLSYEIKARFKLKKEDVDGYRDMIMKSRKADMQESKSRAEEEEAKPVYTALFEGLIDVVEKEGKPAFLIKEGDDLLIVNSLKKDGLLYLPPPKEQIPWLMPRGEEILKLYETQSEKSAEECDRELYDELLAYHKSISELPEDSYYDLITAWDLHTYLLETIEYTPIICLFAVPERGKSRTGKGMIYIAFRGIHVESLRDAYLVRVANDLMASLFLDVKEIWKKAEKNGSEDILLHRFEKGAKVPRVLFPDKGAHRDIVYYSIFGPTIISTNEGIHRILETRAIPINMPDTTRRFEDDVTPLRALPLKEKLITFRARHYGKALPCMPKPALGRLGDILKPIQQIIRLVRPEREAYFLKLVKRLESEKLIEKADTIEAQILAVLSNLRSNVDKGMLPVKEITDSFNEDRSDKYKVTYQRIGRRLSAMGFSKVRTSNGASAIVWDEEKLERIKDSYGLSKTSEIPDTSDTPKDPYVTDVSCDTDVSRRPF